MLLESHLERVREKRCAGNVDALCGHRGEEREAMKGDVYGSELLKALPIFVLDSSIDPFTIGLSRTKKVKCC